MSKNFQTILIPVDFSINTDTAISKALCMVPKEGGIIHLLHVQQIGTSNILKYLTRLVRGYSWKQVEAAMGDSSQRLEDLKSRIEHQRNDIQVYTNVEYGESIEDFIIKKALNLAADLIVLGKHACHSRFSRLNTVIPSRIAQMSGIPVLTAKPGSVNNEIKKVVVPVDARFPATKVAVVEALLRRNMIQVQLVIFSDSETREPFSRQSLPGIFQALKSQSAIPVKYIVLHGANKAKALLDYSNSIQADMLIVNTGTETQIGRWANRHLSDILPAHSKTLILAVR